MVQDPEVEAHLDVQGRTKKSVIEGRRTREEMASLEVVRLCVKASNARPGTQQVLNK